jgi:predicted signal transduction protein with EAL and GGDEF domain
MFQHLRIKLTVLYAGLFCVVLTLIGATAYAVIAHNTQRVVREQLVSAGAVFDEVWHLRLEHLQDGSAHAASAENFRTAVANADNGALMPMLARLRRDLDADLVFLVTAQGLVVREDGAAISSVPPGLQSVLEHDRAPTGLLSWDGVQHQAAAIPILAPNLLGWIVVGEKIDETELSALAGLSAIPLQASLLTQARDGSWRGIELTDHSALNIFILGALNAERNAPSMVETAEGRAIAAVRPLTSLEGTRNLLLLRSPLSSALSPYGALFSTLAAVGIVGLALLLTGTWLLAQSITQPISTLETAARKLEQGVYETTTVRSKDELARLADSFNAMVATIQEREKRITHLAYHDAETRLPNRRALERSLGAAAQQKRFYLAAIGVDRFAHVRGAIGYALAASLLNKLGARLARVVANAPMARLSSDVLGVAFLANDDADARRRAAALVSNLEQPVSLDGHVVDVNVTIGVAQPRGKDETPSAMIERASIALDQARTARAKTAFFDEGAYGDPARNLSLMGEMRQALINGDMTLVHQAKYNFRTGRIDSAEALVRWKHPTRGMISPDLFVPMAEETGHVRALTDWALQRAVEDQKQMSAAGWPMAVSVNVSGRLIGDAEFAQSAVELVRNAPHDICFEITETAIVDNPKVALENIELFAANGIRIAIDDYGSGLSSLAYLKKLPAHELKIDKFFVESITSSQRDALLVRSTIDLGHGLGLKVTAEGVEDPAMFALLAGMGCDMAQGYLVARPSPVSELLVLLNDTRRMDFYHQTAAVALTTAK